MTPTKLTATDASMAAQDAMINTILGVAIFDLNSLPKEYYITPENETTHWVQLVFQALGLKSLLMASLEWEGFFHLAIGFTDQTALVVRTKDSYVAILLKEPLPFASIDQADQLSQWVRYFERQLLRQNVSK